MLLHHPVALRELEPAGQGAGEGAERLPVARSHQQHVRVLLARGPLTELEETALVERYARQVGREGDGADLGRLTIQPDRALAAVRRVVNAGDEVPCHRPPGGRQTVAGRPLPRRMAVVVARALVDERI